MDVVSSISVMDAPVSTLTDVVAEGFNAGCLINDCDRMIIVTYGMDAKGHQLPVPYSKRQEGGQSGFVLRFPTRHRYLLPNEYLLQLHRIAGRS